LKKHASVLHVLGTAERHSQGISRIVENLAAHIDPLRYRVSVLFIRRDGPIGDRFRAAGIPVGVARWEGGLSDPAGAVRFLREVRAMRPDIVHIHAGGLSPRMLARRAGARVLIHYHSLAEESGGRRIVRTARGADLVVANSAATAATVTGSNTKIVYPGVRVPPRIVHEREEDAVVTIGIAARLVPIKGIEYLLPAVAAARRELGAISLQIAGAGPAEMTLRESALAAGIADIVEFHGWRDDVMDVMRGWDIYAQPSLAEGFGVSVLEAMAAGLPVVATAVGGLKEIVEHGRTGWLVPPADSAALAQRIISLARDPDLRKRMGEAGRDRASRHFSLDREAAEIQAAYDTMIA